MSYIGQAEDEWEAAEAKKKHQAKARAKTACPVCGKRVLNVHHHARVPYDTTDKVFFKDEVYNTESSVWVYSNSVELVPEYEAGWKLNDGTTEIPSNAKTLKDDTGEVVAYKLVRKPVIKEYVRYYTVEGRCYDAETLLAANKLKLANKVVFVERDGQLTDVRLEKL